MFIHLKRLFQFQIFFDTKNKFDSDLSKSNKELDDLMKATKRDNDKIEKVKRTINQLNDAYQSTLNEHQPIYTFWITFNTYMK